MAFTDQEKTKIAYHLGYTSNVLGAGIGFGLPTVVSVLYPVWGALEHVMPTAEVLVRRILDIMDAIESKQFEALDYMVAEKVDDTVIRKDYPEALAKEYKRWRAKLSNVTGAPVNPYEATSGGINCGRSC